MKKIIILSVVSSFVLAGNIVNDLEVDQKNEVTNSSSLSNSVTVSQGETNIQNNSNVENVDILQRDGSEAGNLIDNSTINGAYSEVYQGLTSVDSSTLYNTQLTSKNTIQRVNITNGKSVIRQGNLIIGGDSNLSGTAGSGGGGMGMGGSGENLEITQTNLLKDTDIQNSFINQGVTTINNHADVSISFKLDQTNTINRASATGHNDVNSSQLQQGVTKISGGDTSNVVQTIQNVMEDITVDGSSINQSSITLTDSTVSNINSDASSSIDDKNRVSYTTATNNSNIEQSSINISSSTVDKLYKSDRGSLQENNWIHTVTIDNSKIQQSNFNVNNGSDISNVTYLTHSSGVNANNLVYNSTANDSELNQDTTTLDNANLDNNTFTRANTINHVVADNSNLKQFNIEVSNSNLDNSDFKQQGLYWNVTANNANMSQGSTIITD